MNSIEKAKAALEFVATHAYAGGKCFGDVDIVKQGIEALASLPTGEPVAEVISWTNGSYHRNYKLQWLHDVSEGTKLYAAPVDRDAIIDECAIAADSCDVWQGYHAAMMQQADCVKAIRSLKSAPTVSQDAEPLITVEASLRFQVECAEGKLQQEMRENRELRQRLAEGSQDDKRDAERWRETLKHIGGAHTDTGAQRFTLRHLSPVEGANIMRGSAAGHFTDAIDQAIREGK